MLVLFNLGSRLSTRYNRVSFNVIPRLIVGRGKCVIEYLLRERNGKMVLAVDIRGVRCGTHVNCTVGMIWSTVVSAEISINVSESVKRYGLLSPLMASLKILIPLEFKRKMK